VRAGGRLRFTAAVAALRRLPCAARPAVASQNSLRSLRSLRSNSRDESDDEARASARRPRACAARRRSRRCACRPPAPPRGPQWTPGWVHHWFFAKPWAGGRACASAAPRSAAARGLRIAARRGVERSVFEHRAQAACAAGCRPCEGEFCARPRAPSTTGERRCAPTAAVKHGRPPARGFATLDLQGESSPCLAAPVASPWQRPVRLSTDLHHFAFGDSIPRL